VSLRTYVTLEPTTVADVLREANSMRQAAYRLGTTETRLRLFCREDPQLETLQRAVAARGTAKAASARRAFRYGF